MTSPSSDIQVVITMDDINVLFQVNPQVRMQVENIALRRSLMEKEYEIEDIKVKLDELEGPSTNPKSSNGSSKEEIPNAKSGK
jgi:hypothetical protein